MKILSAVSITVLLTVTILGTARADLGDWLDILKSPANENTSASDNAHAGLTSSDMSGALKQALNKGVQHAIAKLGHPGGFLNNNRVRIPMPEKLAWVEKSLRGIGQQQLADDFITSMNSAAEKAVPEVASLFGEAIRSMSLEDARGILQGPDNAATEYFRETSSEALSERMLPIVRQATDATGVTSYYKAMTQKAGSLMQLFNRDAIDLDTYVTNRALDGLFLMIAEEEKQIRDNPLERSTELLKKVFGAL